MKKFKDLFTVILFASVIFAMTAGYIILPDSAVSYAERRKLSEFPELSAETVLSSEFSEKLEGYFLDQAPLRDEYRYLNTFVHMQLLFSSDVNGLWTEDGHIFKMADKLDKKQVQYGKTLINKVIADYMSVREVEKLVRNYLNPPEEKAKKAKPVISKELRDMIDRMQRCFGTKVTPIGNDNKGRIYVDYYTSDDLDRIYEILVKAENANKQ
jgi:hypothetical protein